jgi:hypothetical protein
MEEKKISYGWAALSGLFVPVLQIAIFFVRFGKLNQDASLLDYVIFFLAGTAAGLILIAFLRRSKTMAAKWIVFVTFLLATPMALAGMLLGGLLGPVGVVLFSFLFWLIITGLGFLAGLFLSRNA